MKHIYIKFQRMK